MPNFHDPSRPRIGGRPCWLTGTQSALPNLTIEPQLDGKFLIGLMLELEPGAYVLRAVVSHPDNLHLHIMAYASGPEEWVRLQLGYVPLPTHISRPRPRKVPEGFEPLGQGQSPGLAMSLEDLGL